MITFAAYTATETVNAFQWTNSQTLPLPVEDLNLHLIRGSLSHERELALRTVCRSVQPFLQGSRT